MSELSNEAFFQDVKEILAQARGSAVRAVNSVMVEAYWMIGKRIVKEEQGGSAQATYGIGLLKELSKSLSAEFGQGFSLANLKNFRKFYLTYPEKGKSYTLCSLLSWSHNRLIMREPDEPARLYYLKESKKQNWSVRDLQRQIKTNTFQRLLSTDAEVPPELSPREQILSQFKDPYVLEFLNLSEDNELILYTNQDGETRLERQIEHYNLEAKLRPNGATYVNLGQRPRYRTTTSPSNR